MDLTLHWYDIFGVGFGVVSVLLWRYVSRRRAERRELRKHWVVLQSRVDATTERWWFTTTVTWRAANRRDALALARELRSCADTIEGLYPPTGGA